MPDSFLELDLDRCAKKVEVNVRRQALRKARLLEHEKQVRFANPDMAEYESTGAREALQREEARLRDQVQGADIDRMEREAKKVEDALDGVMPPPGLDAEGVLRAAWVPGGRRESMMLVPTKSVMANMFDPAFWPAMDPKSFPYGDGVYGLERDTP